MALRATKRDEKQSCAGRAVGQAGSQAGSLRADCQSAQTPRLRLCRTVPLWLILSFALLSVS